LVPDGNQSGNITLDLTTGTTHTLTMTGNITKITLTGTPLYFTLVLIQGGSGGYTVAWTDFGTTGGTVDWTAGAPPTLTVTVGHKDSVTFMRQASGTYNGYLTGSDMYH
jgi:hypothetical protein